MRKGIIRGEFEDCGTGLPRQFVFRNLVESLVALYLNELGVGTQVTYAILDALRSGDIESDVRTPWFVEMTRQPAGPSPRRLKTATRRQLKAAIDAERETPLEDRCCAEFNDDGTLKLLKLLRAYVDSGTSEATRMKGLLSVAREHLREEKQWNREYAALHRRWRLFKNPNTRPRNTHFWVVCDTIQPLEEGDSWWRRVTLTDEEKHFEGLGRSVLIVTIRPILEELEAATGDSWRATAEKNVFRLDEPTLTPRKLVAQALHQYELTERKRSLELKRGKSDVPGE